MTEGTLTDVLNKILDAIQNYFTQNPTSDLRQVRVTLYDHPTVEAFLQMWKEKDWTIK